VSVRIRLRRMGAKKQPFYRVVVADSRSPRDGRFLDTIGTYNPRSEPVAIDIDREKTLKWLEEGALPTDSARSLLSQAGIWQEFKTGAPPEASAPPAAPEMRPPAIAAAEAPVEEPAQVAEEPAESAESAESAEQANVESAEENTGEE
jgi:small subunit ribosomal protein S16